MQTVVVPQRTRFNPVNYVFFGASEASGPQSGHESQVRVFVLRPNNGRVMELGPFLQYYGFLAFADTGTYSLCSGVPALHQASNAQEFRNIPHGPSG
jgi:hypothetical protein